MNNDWFEWFNTIPEEYRMLCIDSAAVACYLYSKGEVTAATKLLHTILVTAELDTGLVQKMLENPKKTCESLAIHAELRSLINKISG